MEEEGRINSITREMKGWNSALCSMSYVALGSDPSSLPPSRPSTCSTLKHVFSFFLWNWKYILIRLKYLVVENISSKRNQKDKKHPKKEKSQQIIKSQESKNFNLCILPSAEWQLLTQHFPSCTLHFVKHLVSCAMLARGTWHWKKHIKCQVPSAMSETTENKWLMFWKTDECTVL